MFLQAQRDSLILLTECKLNVHPFYAIPERWRPESEEHMGIELIRQLHQLALRVPDRDLATFQRRLDEVKVNQEREGGEGVTVGCITEEDVKMAVEAQRREGGDRHIFNPYAYLQDSRFGPHPPLPNPRMGVPPGQHQYMPAREPPPPPEHLRERLHRDPRRYQMAPPSGSDLAPQTSRTGLQQDQRHQMAPPRGPHPTPQTSGTSLQQDHHHQMAPPPNPRYLSVMERRRLAREQARHMPPPSEPHLPPASSNTDLQQEQREHDRFPHPWDNLRSSDRSNGSSRETAAAHGFRGFTRHSDGQFSGPLSYDLGPEGPPSIADYWNGNVPGTGRGHGRGRVRGRNGRGRGRRPGRAGRASRVLPGHQTHATPDQSTHAVPAEQPRTVSDEQPRAIPDEQIPTHPDEPPHTVLDEEAHAILIGRLGIVSDEQTHTVPEEQPSAVPDERTHTDPGEHPRAVSKYQATCVSVSDSDEEMELRNEVLRARARARATGLD